jgi:hypothetical protein
VRLTDRQDFDASDCLHEYVLLLRKLFQSLDENQRRQILGWIGAGPLPKQLENLTKNMPAFTGRELSDEDLVHLTKAWRRDWLQRLGDLLPPEKVAERDALIAQLGPHEYPDLPSYRTEVVGSQSPLSQEELAEKSVDEQIQYLRDWAPPDDQFMGPSRTGLGSTAREACRRESRTIHDPCGAFSRRRSHLSALFAERSARGGRESS